MRLPATLLAIAVGFLAPPRALGAGSPELTASIHVFPASPVVMCSTFTVEVRILNSGDTNVKNVSPSPTIAMTCPIADRMWLTPEFGGAVGLVSDPQPSCTIVMFPGQVASWFWTYSATAVGAVDFTITVSGWEIGGPGMPKGYATSTVVIPPPVLSVTVYIPVSRVNVGQTFNVEASVFNAGIAPIADVVPCPYPIAGCAVPDCLWLTPGGGGSVSRLSGPVPPCAPSLLPGQAVSFVWTYLATGAGAMDFTVSVTGASCGGSPPLGEDTASLPFIQYPAILSATVTTSSPGIVRYGDTVTVYLDVFNSGDAAVDDATRFSITLTGSGKVTLLSCPPLASLCPDNPGIAFADIGHVSVTRFTWLYRAEGPGSVTIFVSAGGADHNTGALALSNTASTSFVIPVPSTLSYTITGADGLLQGERVDFSIAVTNQGATQVCQSGFNARIEDQGTVPLVTTLLFRALGDSLLPICYEPGQVRTFTLEFTVPAGLAPGIGVLVLEPVAREAWTGVPAVAVGAPKPVLIVAGRSGICGLSENPWRPRSGPVRICYAVSPDDESRPVSLSVHTITGELVRTLAGESVPAGVYQAVWDGRNTSGQKLASGVYLLLFQSYMAKETRKLAVLQ